MRVARWLARLRLAALALASVLLTLAACEGVLRNVGRGERRPAANTIADLFVAADDPGIVYQHAPGVHLTFPATTSAAGSNPAWHVSTDARGLRRNGDGSDSPPELRGICLGDSIMFGAGLDDEQTIPAQLSVAVSRRLGRRFECLNFGVANYTTVQEVNFFRYQDALRYDPDIVVLEIFTNDFKTELGRIRVSAGGLDLIAPDARGRLAGFWYSLRLADVFGAAGSAFTDLLRRHGLHAPANGRPLRPEEIAAVYGALDELRALLAPRGVPLLVATFPRDWQLGAPDRAAATERQRAVKQYCDRHGVPYVDLLDTFYGQPVEAYFRPGDDGHPHARAARQIAQILAGPVSEILAGAQSRR